MSEHITTPEHETAADVLVHRMGVLTRRAAEDPIQRANLAHELVELRLIGYHGAPEDNCPVCAWCFRGEPGHMREALS